MTNRHGETITHPPIGPRAVKVGDILYRSRKNTWQRLGIVVDVDAAPTIGLTEIVFKGGNVEEFGNAARLYRARGVQP